MICRYRVVEELYCHTKSPASEELNKALVQLYVAILSYLSEVKDYFDQNTSSKFHIPKLY